MTIASELAIHGVTKIHADTYADLESTPLHIEFEGDDWQQGTTRITVHTHNRELSLALVEAINTAVAAVKAKQDLQQAA